MRRPSSNSKEGAGLLAGPAKQGEGWFFSRTTRWEKNNRERQFGTTLTFPLFLGILTVENSGSQRYVDEKGGGVRERVEVVESGKEEKSGVGSDALVLCATAKNGLWLLPGAREPVQCFDGYWRLQEPTTSSGLDWGGMRQAVLHQCAFLQEMVWYL